ncbi:hypothetical protein E2C01_088606 [Portunus trituberculatus]|uniref:Uncharacterized protein n=1 Tax=Portunus trituberculatus TaxID=210409 RepID=A0A5B7JKC0_PORTR|nr:hypothetical protein [Portunus trituberculatus]
MLPDTPGALSSLLASSFPSLLPPPTGRRRRDGTVGATAAPRRLIQVRWAAEQGRCDGGRGAGVLGWTRAGSGPVVPAWPGDNHLWHAPHAPTLTCTTHLEPLLGAGWDGAGRHGTWQGLCFHVGETSQTPRAWAGRDEGRWGPSCPPQAAELSPSRPTDR